MSTQKRQDQGLPDHAERGFRFERHGAVRQPERDIQRGAPAWLAPAEGETTLHRIGLLGMGRRVTWIRDNGAIKHLVRHQRVGFGRPPVHGLAWGGATNGVWCNLVQS